MFIGTLSIIQYKPLRMTGTVILDTLLTVRQRTLADFSLAVERVNALGLMPEGRTKRRD